MRSTLAVVAALLFTTLGACRGAEDGAAGNRLQVVASFYPLAEVSERVGGDLVTVSNLTPAGAEPHDLELAPDDLETIITADVVIYLGGGFQPAVEDAIAQAEGVVVDALEGTDSLPPPAGETEGEEPGHELAADPHVWLDPERYSGIVKRVDEVMAEQLPDHASEIGTNAQAFVDELTTLDAELEAGLETCSSRMLVVSHAAFGYLADAYGLTQEAISVSPEAEPDPARFAELKALVEREGVSTIFAEELVSPKVAETLAREAGVEVEVLNPIEGLTSEQMDAGESYVSLMRENLQTLRRALDCA
jgi:zinc transport system substrate-binding protein